MLEGVPPNYRALFKDAIVWSRISQSFSPYEGGGRVADIPSGMLRSATQNGYERV